MVPCYMANPGLGPALCNIGPPCGTLTVFHTHSGLESDCHYAYEVPVYWPLCMSLTGQYTGMVFPPHPEEMHHCYLPRTHERKLFLRGSLFHLVKVHVFLALADSKLLDWYNCLCLDDKKIIQEEGGLYMFLQRHPSLEVMNHWVYVKHGVLTQPIVTSNTHMYVSQSRAAGTKMCTQESRYTQVGWEMLPTKARKSFTLLSCSDCRSQEQLGEYICHQPVYLQDSYHAAHSSPLTETPCSERTATQFPRSQLLLVNEDVESFQMSNRSSVAESEQPTANSAAACDYHRLNTTQMKATGDDSIVVAVQLEQTDSPVRHGQDYMLCGDERTVHVDKVDLSNNSFHNITNDDQCSLVSLASKDLITDIDTLLGSSETDQSDQTLSSMNSAEKCTSPLPCVQTWNAAVGTEPVPCTSAFTQTEDRERSDKHVNTEVYMLDLDYLAKEFIKLKATTQKLKESNEESSGCKLNNKCECIQRAQQAELSLLAVQYSICRQHCWRLYYTSAEGDQFSLTKDPPENIVKVLQKLEADYNQIKQKILSGVPLRVLKPLSVDSQEIITKASYTPAQIIVDVLGDTLPWTLPEQQKQNAEESMSPDDESLNTCQMTEKSNDVHNSHNNNNVSKNRSRAVTVILQDRGANDKQERKESPADKDNNTDNAGEDHQLSEPTANGMTTEGAESSILYISNLPSNMTENDVLLLCEKYQPSDVSISALKNGFRVAIVMVSGAQSAEAAVRELNGHRMQGHALHLEHISRAVCGSGLKASQNATKPQTFNTDTSNADGKLKTPPLGSSVTRKLLVSDSPTAKGTFVPQHHGTMASLDTLLDDLAKLHPDVGKQRIMNALMELWVNHRGILSSMSLRTIREMMSNILT